MVTAEKYRQWARFPLLSHCRNRHALHNPALCQHKYCHSANLINPTIQRLQKHSNCQQTHQKLVHSRISVADQGCLSRILIFIHPRSRNSHAGFPIRIQYPTTAEKREEKYHKFKNYFTFEQRIIVLFNCH